MPLSATAPGQELANDIFDVWWWHNAGSPVLCVATNGSGKGWSGDGGSLSSRGSGYTQLSLTARGYLTNKNDFTSSIGAHCYGLIGSSALGDYVASAPGGKIPANQLTYLGSFYTTAVGQTSFVPQPTPASGGANALVALWNGYNRVPLSAVEQDTASPYPAKTAATWEIADSHAIPAFNSITVLDGNQQTPFDLSLAQVVSNVGSVNPQLSIWLATSQSPSPCAVTTSPSTYTSQQSTSPISVAYKLSKPPLLGLQCAQAQEKAGNNTSIVFNNNSTLTLSLNWQY